MSEKVTRLDSIPYDIFYQIVSGLDCTDFNNLSQVNRTIHDLMSNESISKKSVEVRNPKSEWPRALALYREADNVGQCHISHTKEAQLAMRGEIKYREALRRVFRVKEAVATARPYFVAVLSYGNVFIYNHGYIYADEI